MGKTGDDLLCGGAGRDQVRYDYDDQGYGGVHGIMADLNLGRVVDTSGDTDTLITIEDISGSVFADVVLGRGGSKACGQNGLNGNGGDDTIDGRGGIDILTGGDGADTFVFSSRQGYDYLRDFAHGQDHIQLSPDTFRALGTAFTRDEFHRHATADPDSAIYYDSRTGVLSYEFHWADRSSAAGIIAQLNPGDIVSFSDLTFF